MGLLLLALKQPLWGVGGGESQESQESSPWDCQHCTFTNAGLMVACEVCGMAV